MNVKIDILLARFPLINRSMRCHPLVQLGVQMKFKEFSSTLFEDSLNFINKHALGFQTFVLQT